MGQVENGGDVLLGPIDRVGKTRDQDHHGLWVGREDLLDQFLLPAAERNVLSIYGFAALAIIIHFHPFVVWVRTVAHANDGDVRGLRQRDGRRNILSGGVLNIDRLAQLVPDARERGYSVRGSASIPIANHLVTARTDNGGGF